MPAPTERTRLLAGSKRPEYVFNTNLSGEREKRVKRFQCCLCGIFLTTLLAAIIIIVACSINASGISPNNTASSTVNGSVLSPNSFFTLFARNWPIPDVQCWIRMLNDHTEWGESLNFGKKKLRDKDDIQKYVPPLPLQSPSYRHQKVIATSDRARNLSRIGYIEEFALRHMYRNKPHNVTIDRICHYGSVSLTSTFCETDKMECNFFQKYRSYDGTCNNLKHPKFYGVSYRPFRRALPPDYADGISKPRAMKDGNPLPSARTVSLMIHRPSDKNDPKFSVMLAIWGQFLDHDVTATALSQKFNGDSISCCGQIPDTVPECFPVDIDVTDPFSKYNVTCIEFVRSAPAPTCCLGPREQLNQVTSFIDASVVYGVHEEVGKKLRNFRNGTLKMYVTKDSRSLLPISYDLNDGCNREEEQKKGKYCFSTGDARANENLHLTCMHLLWARQHNLIALNLSQLNPHWDDETIFQETRRVIGAQIQHITYNEFLPILLGNKLIKKLDLAPQSSGYFLKYNDSIDPNIANNFATAAFRFAHSIIPGLMKLLANDTSSPEFIQMHKMLFDPFKLYSPEGLDTTLRGALNTTIEASDSYFTDEIKTHLFEKTAEQIRQPKLCGLDLVSLNIQRGRDHGLPGYTLWRRHCGLQHANKFNDLKNDMDKESLRNIRRVYRNVDDIDLYTGALSEKPIEGSILGPTLTCLILDQFVRLKYGDRFWYENPKKPQAFTLDQLNEIRKSSLANIICNNADSLSVIRPKVMQALHSKNNYIPCSDISKPDISLWKEKLDRLIMFSESINVASLEKN